MSCRSVVSAAVILKGINMSLLKDSKKISFKRREKIAEHIKCYSWYAIGIATVEEILNLNILQASLLSMKRAVNQLSVKPGLTLIDGNFAPAGLRNCITIINGDERIKVISAASIIAKVYRDKFMIKLSKNFPITLGEKFWVRNKSSLRRFEKIWCYFPTQKDFKPIHKILSS